MFLFIQSAHAADGAGGPAMIMQWIFPLAIFAIFYFLIIRPQSKRAKEHKNMVDSLSIGNEVIFAGGLMGKVKSIDGDYAVVSLNERNEVMVQRASVISILPKGTIDGMK